MLRTLAVFAVLAASPSYVRAQAPPTPGAGSAEGDNRAAFAGMAHVMGEVTATDGNTIQIRTGEGTTATVVTTSNTRIMKDRASAHITDLHPGDGLMALGNLDAPAHTLHAAVVMAQDAAEVKAMRENLGKTYITGRVTGIDLDDARLTVERPDHVSQTIGLDESTSFRRAVRRGAGGAPPAAGTTPGAPGQHGQGGGRGFGGGLGMDAANIDEAFNRAEPITLADIKVGDTIAGTGALKGGTFVPTKLLDRPAGPRREPHNPQAGAADTPTGGAH